MSVLIKLFVVIVVLVAAYVVFQGVRFLWLVHVSKGLVEHSVRFERIVEGDPSMRILFVGDSTAVGTGVEDSVYSTAGYAGQEFPEALIKNVSENGWKVVDALEHFPQVADQEFDVIVLQIGANDIIRSTPIEEFTASLSALFEKATASGKHVVALHSGNIGLAPLFPWPVSTVLTNRTKKYREEYIRITEQYGVAYVDLFAEKDNDPFYNGSGFYAEDKLHLTKKGYAYWYKKIRENMEIE